AKGSDLRLTHMNFWDILQFYSFNQSMEKEETSHIELFFHYSFDRLRNNTRRDSQMACRFC
ncbi:MAG: hypothetical protein K8R37_14485, partial [Bacteroidales bacterium]|nr:hypothetical protein [Bacteroidales bacterium]